MSHKPVGLGADLHRNVRALQSNNRGGEVPAQGLGLWKAPEAGRVSFGEPAEKPTLQVRPTEAKAKDGG